MLVRKGVEFEKNLANNTHARPVAVEAGFIEIGGCLCNEAEQPVGTIGSDGYRCGLQVMVA